MKINFITTFLITYLIQIPYVYTADAATPCSWSDGKECATEQTVFYEFTTTEDKRYSLKACQTFPPEKIPSDYTGDIGDKGYIGEKCNGDSPTNLPCYADSEEYETKKVYYVEPTFLLSTFDHDGASCFYDEIQNICEKELPSWNCYSDEQGSSICRFTVDPENKKFVLKGNCVLEVSTVDSNNPYLQFVRNGKIYSCATQLGEDAEFVYPFTYPVEAQDGTIENPGGQNSLDDCVLKRGSEASPYKDDAGQYIFTSDTCSDLYCTDITADLCGGVS